MAKKPALILLTLLLWAGGVQAARPGVGLEIPSWLPAEWRSQWCPQLRPQGDWAGHPNAVAAGWDWRAHCPLRGWSGWFAEFFPRTIGALTEGCKANMWGTAATHDCQPTLREFEYAEVFWDKSHPAYKLAEGYPWDFSGNGAPPPPTEPIPPELLVQVLVGGSWVDDTVKVRSGQGVTFTVTRGTFRVADEGRTWRRRTAGTPPTPRCGDGQLGAGETCATCPADAGECPPPPPPCPACPPVGVTALPADCQPLSAIRESAEVIARNVFTAQRRRQRVADCMKAIERAFGGVQ